MAVLGYNRSHPDQITLKAVSLDKTEIKYLANDKGFPPGLLPALASQSGYIVVASAPEVIRRFGAPAGKGQAMTEAPVLRLSFAELRRFLKERREPLAAFVAEQNKITKEEALARMDALQVSTQAIDRLEVTQRSTGPGLATWTLRVQTAWPLK